MFSGGLSLFSICCLFVIFIAVFKIWFLMFTNIWRRKNIILYYILNVYVNMPNHLFQHWFSQTKFSNNVPNVATFIAPFIRGSQPSLVWHFKYCQVYVCTCMNQNLNRWNRQLAQMFVEQVLKMFLNWKYPIKWNLFISVLFSYLFASIFSSTLLVEQIKTSWLSLI